MKLLALVVGIAIIPALPGAGTCAELTAGIALGPPTFALELADFAAAVGGGPARYPDAQAAIDSTWVVEHAYHTAGVEPPGI